MMIYGNRILKRILTKSIYLLRVHLVLTFFIHSSLSILLFIIIKSNLLTHAHTHTTLTYLFSKIYSSKMYFPSFHAFHLMLWMSNFK